MDNTRKPRSSDDLHLAPKMDVNIGWNLKKPIIEVLHEQLENFSEQSLYKKICPKCNRGILLVNRNKQTLKLEEEDFCNICGQHFRYIDIRKMREELG